MEWDGVGWSGMEWDEVRLGWDGIGVGLGWIGTDWDGMEWDEIWMR